jgi:hypothetical protein
MQKPKRFDDLDDDTLRAMIASMTPKDHLDLIARLFFAGPQAQKCAIELLRRHLEDIGTVPRMPTLN